MGFVTTGIGTWVNENTQDLISKAILEANSVQDFTVIPGIKYKEQIKFVESATYLQAQACGTPTNSGSTTLTDKDIEVIPLMVYKEWCPADLEKTSLQLSLKPGFNTDLPFEATLVELEIKNIQKQLEQMIWANTASGSTAFEGLIHIAEADTDVVDRTFVWSGTTYTAANYMAEVYGMVNALPAEIQSLDDLTLFCGFEISRKMIQAFVTAGIYQIDYTDKDGNTNWIFPGTNITVKPKSGLNATNSVFLTPASNLIFGTDMLNEEEKFKLWWSEDSQLVKFIAHFKAGVSYYFGSYIVLSNNI